MVGRLPVCASVALLVLIGFAGCIGDSKGGGVEDDGETDTGGDPVFTQSTGAIGGYVLDVAFSPIAGATVSLTKDGKALQNVTTDETGTYALSEVTPGSYLVLANKSGFRPKSKSVTVSAGTLVREQFLLEQAPTVTPYIDETIEFHGYLECSGPLGRCISTAPQGTGNHRPSGSYPVKEGLQAMLFEMVWSPSRGTGLNDGGAGPLGGGMTLSISWTTPAGLGAASANSLNGQTIRIYLERRLNDAGEYRTFCVEGCNGSSRDWPYQAGGVVSFSGSPNAPNVVIARPFEIYVTAFYYQMMPEGFTGIPD